MILGTMESALERGALDEEVIDEQLWEPATDISEDEKEYVVKVELPEMKKEDVKVALQGNICRCTGYWNIVEAVVAAGKGGSA